MRTVIVTGAAGGIGSATVNLLDANGWHVIPVDLIATDHPNGIVLDVGDPEAVASGLGGVERVDGLVNNAAIQMFKDTSGLATDDWDAVMDVNLRGAFACLKAVRRQLVEAKGSVVNVSSVHATATSASTAAYAAAKGGLAAFTRAAAIELGPDGVRVNSVSPGAIRTAALSAGLDRSPGGEARLAERTPLGRIGDPDDVARAIHFLLDGSQSGFVTGADLTVDGGALARLSTE